MEVIAEKGVVITPKIFVNGGNGDKDGNLIFNTFLADMLDKNESDDGKPVKKTPSTE